jgi:hypothetical protein
LVGLAQYPAINGWAIFKAAADAGEVNGDAGFSETVRLLLSARSK